jgi:hypothetical protein
MSVVMGFVWILGASCGVLVGTYINNRYWKKRFDRLRAMMDQVETQLFHGGIIQ